MYGLPMRVVDIKLHTFKLRGRREAEGAVQIKTKYPVVNRFITCFTQGIRVYNLVVKLGYHLFYSANKGSPRLFIKRGSY